MTAREALTDANEVSVIRELMNDYFTTVVPHLRRVNHPGMRCGNGCPCTHDSAIVASLLRVDPRAASEEDWDEAWGAAIDVGMIEDEDEDEA